MRQLQVNISYEMGMIHILLIDLDILVLRTSVLAPPLRASNLNFRAYPCGTSRASEEYY